MAKALIKNLTANPLGLPPPFSGVIAGAGGTIVDLAIFGGATANEFAEVFVPLLGGPHIVEIVEARDSDPTGPLTPEVSAGLIRMSLKNLTTSLTLNAQRIEDVANPTDPQDVTTKAYVDTAISGAVPALPLALANNSVAIVTSTSVGQGAPGDSVTFLSDAASAHGLVVSGLTVVDFNFSGIASGFSVSTAALLKTGDTGAGDNINAGSFASVTKWIGAAPVLPTADAVPTYYLVVATNMPDGLGGSIVVGSWQALS